MYVTAGAPKRKQNRNYTPQGVVVVVVTVVVVQRKVTAVTQPVSRSADVKRVEYVPSAFIMLCEYSHSAGNPQRVVKNYTE